jgi:hypothetical protein
MKRTFKQQLCDYLFLIISKNNWDIDFACEKDLNQLFDISTDKISHTECGKEEMRQLAKTNLLHLLAYMQLDAKQRGLYYLDSASISNALTNFNSLWPFKGTEAGAKKQAPLNAGKAEFAWYY